MRICISEKPTRLEIRERQVGAAGGTEETIVPLRHAADARALLRRHCLGTAAIGKLRQLLGAGAPGTPGTGEDQVLDQVAERLAAGGLQLVSIALPAASVGATSAGAGAAIAPAPGPAVRRPPVMDAAAPLPPPRPRDAENPAPPTPELNDAVDQDAQAATLEQAARDGTPFCAVCAKAAADAA